MQDVEIRKVAKIVALIRETYESSGQGGFVLGLSGGIDSALVLALAVEAGIPASKIRTYWMPYDNSFRDKAYDLAKHFGVSCETIDITKAVDAIRPNDVARGDKLRLGNIMARMRMVALYDQASKHHSLVFNTGNLSEYVLGYCTKYGDGAGDIAPILHLTKTEVYEMSAYLNVPNWVLDATPSANLYPGQTDEGDFGFTYEDLDRLIEAWRFDEVERYGSFQFLAQIYAWMIHYSHERFGLSDTAWDAIIRRNVTTEHKRKAMVSLL